MSKPRQKVSKTKLRMMNEVSAAEAQRSCDAAMDRGDFPKDIAADGFLEFFKPYSEMRSAGVINRPLCSGNDAMPSVRKRSLEVEELEAGSARAKEEDVSISDADLDKKLPAGSREREVFDLLRQNPGISNQGIGERLHISESTVKTHLLRAFHKLGLKGGRKEVRAKYPPRKT